MSKGRNLVVVGVVVAVLVAAAVVVVVLDAVGGGGDADDLAARALTANGEQRVVAVDMEAAREADDADDVPYAELLERRDEFQRLLAAQIVLPHLVQLRPNAPDLSDALDFAQITAMAGNMRAGEGGVVALTTEQEWDDVAAGFEDVGYVRDGDLLTLPDSDASAVVSGGYTYTAVSHADGVLALSTDFERGPELVETVLGDPDADDEVLDVLGDLEGPLRGYVPIPDEAEGDCVSAYTVDDPMAGAATLALHGDRPDDVEVVLDDAPFSDQLELGEPVVEDDRVEIEAEASDRIIGGPAVVLLSQELVYSQLYTCP